MYDQLVSVKMFISEICFIYYTIMFLGFFLFSIEYWIKAKLIWVQIKRLSFLSEEDFFQKLYILAHRMFELDTFGQHNVHTAHGWAFEGFLSR